MHSKVLRVFLYMPLFNQKELMMEDFNGVKTFTGEDMMMPSTPDQPSAVLAEAAAQREIAQVQASMAIAKRFPRDQKKALDRILVACQRPSLAEKALYSYARGGTDITGPSIRLAEAIAQQWGNIEFGVRELEQRIGESTVQAYAWDLETNTRKAIDFQVRHYRQTKKGGYNLTDPRDIYEMVANLGARRVRSCILAVIPGDVVEAAQEECESTLKAKADTSPEALQKMLTVFGEYGVNKAMIEARIQRKLESITAAQVIALRKIFNSLRDGMSRPEDWFDLEADDLPPEKKERKTRSDKDKPRKSPETAPEPDPPIPLSPPPTDAPQGDSGAHRGILEGTIALIRDAQEATGLDLSLPYADLGLSPNLPLEEILEEDGQAILAWYQKK
jgi:hypothetical protein